MTLSPDQTTPDELWAQYCAAHPEFAGAPTPEVEQFGYSPEVCDDRVELVLDGIKRATSDLLADYGDSPRGMPGPGDHWIAVDGRGVARAVLRTTVTRVGEVATVEEDFAYDNGEGDRSRDAWLDEHRALFAENLPEINRGLELEPVVFERFALVWPPDRITVADQTWIESMFS